MAAAGPVDLSGANFVRKFAKPKISRERAQPL
jgi:hypothetical protein